MPAQTTAKPKETRLSIRASEQEKRMLAQAAGLRRMNTSQFVLQASLDAAQAILVDQMEFRLSPEQWDAFCKRLDDPPRVLPAIRKLFSEPDPWGE